jgi:integrase
VLLLLRVAWWADAGVRSETLEKAAEIRRLRKEVGLTITQVAQTLGLARSTLWYLEDAGRRAAESVSQTRTIVALLAASGARNTEICLMRPMDLDFTHHKIRVYKSKTRKGVREIDMTPWLAGQLSAWVDWLSLDYDPGQPLFSTDAADRSTRTPSTACCRRWRPRHSPTFAETASRR